MFFSSLTFLFVFLPIFLLIYFISKDKLKNSVILIFSLFFYSWGEPKYIILMLLSIILNYVLAILIDKYRKKAKLFLFIDIVLNIGLLFVFKYLDFAILNLNKFFNLGLHTYKLLLPIGISFYTFQILSYVVDVYKKEVAAQKNIITLGAYISLFPQLIAGPIVRYSTIEQQLQSRTVTVDKFAHGTRRFIIGLGKKVIIANNVAIIADTIFNGHLAILGWQVLVIGALAYTFQIYFDFSGYSDMAIGLGEMLGFEFLENFNFPYISKSITDFWRRWHISLSTWFKDYVYIPLGGNRVKKWKWIRNILVVWTLTGLWHGASWNYILWGAYFAIILLIEKLFLHKILEKLPSILSWLYAFILICIGWIIFRLESISSILIVFENIFTLKSIDMRDFIANNSNLLNYVPYFILAIIGSTPLVSIIINKITEKNNFTVIFRDIWILSVFLLSIAFLLQSTYNPFIYFRF